MMNVFTEEDKQYIKSLGHTPESVEEQLSIFKNGYRAQILRTATIDDGIQNIQMRNRRLCCGMGFVS